MRSSKSRSRSKSNRNRPSGGGNVVNRVFDSSGPEGKVRGTPQQIIDKYNQLARDAQLSGDRVATENFQQHAEHYLRMLAEAQKEQDARREEQERQNRERQAERDRERAERQERESSVPDPSQHSDAIDVVETSDGDDSGLVETPESAPKKPSPRRTRSKSSEPKQNKPAAKEPSEPASDPGSASESDAPEAAE